MALARKNRKKPQRSSLSARTACSVAPVRCRHGWRAPDSHRHRPGLASAAFTYVSSVHLERRHPILGGTDFVGRAKAENFLPGLQLALRVRNVARLRVRLSRASSSSASSRKYAVSSLVLLCAGRLINTLNKRWCEIESGALIGLLFISG
jgi:hypothetical protein